MLFKYTNFNSETDKNFSNYKNIKTNQTKQKINYLCFSPSCSNCNDKHCKINKQFIDRNYNILNYEKLLNYNNTLTTTSLECSKNTKKKCQINKIYKLYDNSANQIDQIFLYNKFKKFLLINFLKKIFSIKFFSNVAQTIRKCSKKIFLPFKSGNNYNYNKRKSNFLKNQIINYYYLKFIKSFYFFCLLLIFLNTVFTPIKKVTAITSNLNLQEKKLLQNLYLKKFGLENLIEQINKNNHEIKSTSTQKFIKPYIPNYIWNIYNKAKDENRYDVVRHYLPISTQTFITPFKTSFTVTYNLSTAINQQMLNEKIVYSTLRISFNNLNYVHKNNLSICGSIVLYKITKFDKKFRSKKNMHIITSKLINCKEQLIDFNVTNLLNNSNMITFQINYFDQIIKQNKSKTFSKNSAALIVYINSSNNNEFKKSVNKAWYKSRSKRSITNSELTMHRQRKNQKNSSKDNLECQRSEMYVDFTKLNWQDWILAPVGYNAFQCSGSCFHPMPSHLNTTNHAIIQSLINSIDPNSVPQPSCVPIEMSAISILYRDLNNVIVVKTYPDMRVEACGCH